MEYSDAHLSIFLKEDFRDRPPEILGWGLSVDEKKGGNYVNEMIRVH